MRSADSVEHVIDLGQLRPAVLNGVRLLLETAIIPTLLLYVCLATVGEVAGLAAVLGWCALTVTIRMAAARRIPGTLLLCVAMLVGRTSLALAFSSIYVYLLQPVAGSILMAMLFIGSALLRRPITMRLAQDFVHVPVRLVADRRVRRMFIQVSLLWGASRLLDAAMSLGMLRWGVEAGLFSRGLLSGVLTAVSIVACTYWGWSRLMRIPGVVLRLGVPVAAPVLKAVSP